MHRRSWGSLQLLVMWAVIFTGSSAWAGQAAEWEITTTMEIPGMPFAMPANTFRHCLDEQAVPYQSKEDQKCETVFKKVSGNSVNWKIKCVGGDGPVELDGVTSYSGGTMDSTVNMKTGQGAMTMRMTGKRLGPCR